MTGGNGANGATGGAGGSGGVGGTGGTGNGGAATNGALGGTGGVGGDVYGGGLVGQNTGTITNAYATGNASSTAGTPGVGGVGGAGGNGGAAGGGTVGANGNGVAGGTGGAGANAYVGGLLGSNNTATITDTYSIGTPSGIKTAGATGGSGGAAGTGGSGGSSGGSGASGGAALQYVGGVTGNPLGGTYVSTYWNITTSGKSNGVGNGGNPSGMTGTSTIQMEQQATFSGWDFTTPIWVIQSSTYPYFNFQTVPNSPTNVVATAGNGQATITFTPPGNTGGSSIISYTVIDGTDTYSATSTGSPITVTGLSNGTAYTFTVTATNGQGVGAASSISNSVTPSTIPGVPTGVTATSSIGQATISFSAPSSTGGSAILYYTAIDNTNTFSATSTGSPITVTGLTAGAAYTFTITATNVAGTSASSTASNSVTVPTIPNAPASLSATPGNAQVGLSWSAPSSTGGSAITNYAIYYQLTSTSTWQQSGLVPGASTTATVSGVGLINGTSYNFEVYAINAVGTSTSPSNIVSSTPSTIPGVPTGVTATSSIGQATISFSAPSSTGGSAILYYTAIDNTNTFSATSTGSPITR